MTYELKKATFQFQSTQIILSIALTVKFLQGNTADALPGDKSNFNSLMSELKEKFNGKYLLTMATAAGKDKINDCKYVYV